MNRREYYLHFLHSYIFSNYPATQNVISTHTSPLPSPPLFLSLSRLCAVKDRFFSDHLFSFNTCISTAKGQFILWLHTFAVALSGILHQRGKLSETPAARGKDKPGSVHELMNTINLPRRYFHTFSSFTTWGLTFGDTVNAINKPSNLRQTLAIWLIFPQDKKVMLNGGNIHHLTDAHYI